MRGLLEHEPGRETGAPWSSGAPWPCRLSRRRLRNPHGSSGASIIRTRSCSEPRRHLPSEPRAPPSGRSASCRTRAPRSSPMVLRFRRICAGEAPGREIRFAVDSPVEGEGFEPSVPLATVSLILAGRRGCRLIPRGRAPQPRTRPISPQPAPLGASGNAASLARPPSGTARPSCPLGSSAVATD